MNAKTWLVLGASLGTLAVAAGTFGAHYLPKYLEASGASAMLAERQQWWETGVRYQMYHALALLAVAWVADRRQGLLVNLAGLAMFAGALVFSMCLYAMGLSGIRVIGAVVPIGGVLLIAGWVMLAIAGRGIPTVDPQGKKLTSADKLAEATKPVSEEPERAAQAAETP